MNAEIKLHQPQSSTASALVVPSSPVERFEITELKDIKIKNFSSETNNVAVSKIVYLKEKHDSLSSEWFEPLFELVVHPNGYTSDSEGFISAMIRKFWFHPYFVINVTTDFLKCTVSVLDINGSQRYFQSFTSEGLLSPGWKLDVFNTDDIGLDKFLRRTALIDRTDELLPQDVLTVRFEIFFEFFVETTKVRIDPVNRFYTPVTDNVMNTKSILSMIEYAFDEIIYVLHLQSLLEDLFSDIEFVGEQMLSPVSDGWEKVFAIMYLRSCRKRQTKVSAFYGGWVNGSNVGEPSDSYLVLSKVSAEIERRCIRTQRLARIKHFLLISRNGNYLYDNEANDKSLKSIVSTMFVTYDMILDIFLGKQSIQVPSQQDLVNHKLLEDLPILFLSHLVYFMDTLSTRVVISMSLKKCSFFIPKCCAISVFDEEKSRKEVANQQNVEIECEIGGASVRAMVDTAGTHNEVADESMEIKTWEQKQESIVGNEEEKDLKSQIGKLHQEIENEEEINHSFGKVAHDDLIVENIARNKEESNCRLKKVVYDDVLMGNATYSKEREDLKPQIGKMNQEIENEESLNCSFGKVANDDTIVENVARNEEEKKCSFEKVAYDDVLMGNAAYSEEKDLKSQIGKMHQKIEKEEEINCSFGKVADDDEAARIQEKGNKIETEGIKLEYKVTELDRAGRCEVHKSDESEDMWQLVSQTRDIDGHLLQANSLMVEGYLLKESSLVFQRTMETCMQEQAKKQIRLDVEFETLELLVDYLKTGKLSNKDNYDWMLLYKLAHLYDIQRLLPICSEQIAQNVTLYNSTQLAEFAEFYQDDHLSKEVERFFKGFDNIWVKKEIFTKGISKINFESENDKTESHTEKYVFYQ